MIYRSFQDLKLSGLGMGGMRFPMLPEDGKTVDEAAVTELVDYAMGHGINYYDTAWGYHDGQSEVALGKALRRYPRDSYILTNKGKEMLDREYARILAQATDYRRIFGEEEA